MESVAVVIDSAITSSGGGPDHGDGIASTSLQIIASPKLSRRTQAEVESDNEVSSEDPHNYPLHSPWCFWFDRSANNISMTL